MATGIRKFTGSGSPEGVISAPPGSTYIQTDAAAGSELWDKATGIGNTGWRVRGSGGGGMTQATETALGGGEIATQTITDAGTDNLRIVTPLKLAGRGFERTTNKGAASGYAPLDATSKVPAIHMPALAINDTFTVASQAAMVALVAQRGDLAIRTDFDPDRSYILTTDDPTVAANWVRVTFGDVVSVNGQTGVVSLTAANVGAITQAEANALYKAIGYVPAWAEITGKPATFPPDAHNHDAVYVNETDHTKAAHDTLAINAGTVDGFEGAALEKIANKGVASGYAPLDATSKVPAIHMPSLAINDTFTVASQAAMVALTAQRGDLAIRTDFDPDRSYILTTDDPTVAANWVRVTFGDVVSVNGRTGVVTGLAENTDPRFTDARTPTSHGHAGADVTSGTIDVARIGTGTKDATTFYRGDGTFAVPAGGAYHARIDLSANTTLTGSTGATFVRIPFDNQIFSTVGTLDTTNGRFTPNRAGWYLAGGTLQAVSSNVQANKTYFLRLYKNGVNHDQVALVHAALIAAIQATGLGTVHCNGTTDYLELWAATSATANIIAAPASFFFVVYLGTGDAT